MCLTAQVRPEMERILDFFMSRAAAASIYIFFNVEKFEKKKKKRWFVRAGGKCSKQQKDSRARDLERLRTILRMRLFIFCSRLTEPFFFSKIFFICFFECKNFFFFFFGTKIIYLNNETISANKEHYGCWFGEEQVFESASPAVKKDAV